MDDIYFLLLKMVWCLLKEKTPKPRIYNGFYFHSHLQFQSNAWKLKSNVYNTILIIICIYRKNITLTGLTCSLPEERLSGAWRMPSWPPARDVSRERYAWPPPARVSVRLACPWTDHLWLWTSRAFGHHPWMWMPTKVRAMSWSCCTR